MKLKRKYLTEIRSKPATKYCPRENSSGSIQGKNRIYKRGGKNLRDVLYMCVMNAIKTNPACKSLYERLRANGKTGSDYNV